MQSVVIQGLDKVTKALEDMPQVIREARGEVMEEMGKELLSSVQHRIGYLTGSEHRRGSDHVADVQEYRVGSGKGYVAVRAKAEAYIDGYAAGYITNALEGGHNIRRPNTSNSGSKSKVTRVAGKYMYRDSQLDAAQLADEAARRIENAAVNALK